MSAGFGVYQMPFHADLIEQVRQVIIETVRSELRTARSSFVSPERPEFLTVRDAMFELKMSRSELYRRFASGDLTLVKRGRRSLVSAAEVATFAELLRQSSRGSPE